MFHPKAEYTFFLSAHGTFPRIDHIMGQKSILLKFERTEITISIFYDHNFMRLEIKYKEKKSTNTNTWKINNMLLNNQWISIEIKEEIKKYQEINDKENKRSKIYGMQPKQL